MHITADYTGQRRELLPLILLTMTILSAGCSGASHDRAAAQPAPTTTQSAPTTTQPAPAAITSLSPGDGPIWMLSGVALHLLLPDPAAVRLGDSGRTLLIVGRQKLDLLPPGSKAIPVATFTSFGDLNSAISNDRLDSRIKAVLYDNEGWSLTPKYERLRPAEFEARAAAVAHAHGYMFISTPAVNLANVVDPTPGRVFPKFLSQGIARDAASVADVFEIQAQGAQTNTQLYADFVTRAAEQARQANPHVIVLAGLSTNPNGPEVTADDLFNVVNATRSVVDGYWLNIPIPGPSCPNCRPTRPDIAIDLLHRLGI